VQIEMPRSISFDNFLLLLIVENGFKCAIFSGEACIKPADVNARGDGTNGTQLSVETMFLN